MKKIFKKILPSQLLLLYHYLLARMAAAFYGFPSRRMTIIGITGTKGKTSTANFIWAALTAGGIKTGLISTANIRIGSHESMNRYHMTMPGPFIIQRLMARMVREGCTVCIIETTSEGIKQFRHKGITYNILVFTNLFPEHLQAHGGSFEKYKQTKGKLFSSLRIPRMIIANADSEHAAFFLSFPADKKITFGSSSQADNVAKDIISTQTGVSFCVGEKNFRLSLLGEFNVANALPAIIIARELGISDEKISSGLQSLHLIPGRMEIIDEGQSFMVIVDYAHEEKSIGFVLATAREQCKAQGKVIILLGAEGGGRDKAKRPVMGKLSAQFADVVVVSNVDPYEDDPKEILEDIAQAAEQNGKVRGKNLFVIEDRQEGIRKALSLAISDDVVLITGKGAEQSIVIDGISRPWDDRTVVRKELITLARTQAREQTTPPPL